MTPTESACAFVQIVAQADPYPGNDLDRGVINAARLITRRLHAENNIYPGLGRPLAPVAASGIPITRSKV
ncbi:hypothetical protein H5J25_13710 [Sphingomonas aliaeris]|uniref:Uncharacterized protein n=1 Tax=Sphingomonas aliaeris TaxID=2759526 RepID=A0A974NT89_9SPHN|nr:hypothetical protein [Sphingomonas aliaeris]QQV76501.1 hypothetical protein H5J25_13710 [Sphingomonas aliaeris]